MKKALFMIVLSIVLLFNLTSTHASETDEPYSGYAAQSDYDRISKVDGVWYGVITVDDFELFKASNVQCMGYFCDNRNEIYLSFSRDVDQVTEITYQYQFEDSCDGLSILGYCLGNMVSPDYEITTVFNKYEDGTLREFLSFDQDNIRKLNDDFTLWTNDKHYDFLIASDTNKDYDEVKLISFKLILTDAEVEELRLDIQAQYEQELHDIKNNTSLTASEKQSLINNLNAEYSEYEIDFGEEMEVPCVGDCEIDLPDDEISLLDKWFDEMLSWLKVNVFSTNIIQTLVVILIVTYITGTIVWKSSQALFTKALDGIFGLLGSIANMIFSILQFYTSALSKGLSSIIESLMNIFK